jgi:hypothetical protein
MREGEEGRPVLRKTDQEHKGEGGLPMKVSVVITTALVCGLGGGYSDFSWSGDLDSALEKINISTEAQISDKSPDKDALPCVKSTGVTCVTTYEDTNSNYTQASVIQQGIVRGNVVGNALPGVFINGATSGQGFNGSTSGQ